MGADKLILLLDIDGVLLESHGYRLACIDTINHMISAMGQPGLSIDRSVTDAFESAGIRAEWDMIPLALAAFSEWCLSCNCVISSEKNFPPVFGGRELSDRESFLEMMREQAWAFGRCLDPALPVMEGIYAAFMNGSGKGLDRLRETAMFQSFFTDTLDPGRRPFFAELENRLLGKEVFEEFFGLRAPVDCGSYLAEKDVPLIDAPHKELLTKISGNAPVYPVVMTYRPTRMPAAPERNRNLYYVNTPEGECAMALLGWDGGRMKMIGSGSLCYEEDRQRLRREYYTKPHPFHGISSVLYALCGDQLKALDLAARLCGEDPVPGNNPAGEILKRDEPIRIAVFEDSATGIQCADNAAAVLRKWGIDAEVIRCGIRTIPEKDVLLAECDAVLFNNINEALDAVLEKYSGRDR